MSDPAVASRSPRLALAKTSLKAAFAGASWSGSPMSLVMVGLMGEPPWLRRSETSPGVLWGRLRARALADDGDIAELTRLRDRLLRGWTREQASPAQFLIAALLVVATTGVCLLLRPYMQVGSLVLPFLIAIVLAAVGLGLLPSLFAGALSVLSYDYLFLQPLYSLVVSDPNDVMRLAIFALTALIVSNLAAYARRQTVTASLRAEIAEDLFQFGRLLAGAASIEAILEVSLPRLRAMFRAQVAIILQSDGGVPVCGRGQDAADVDFAGTKLADIPPEVTAWLRDDKAGLDALPESAHWLFVPMLTARRKVGVLAISRDGINPYLVPNSAALFGTVADLLAQAIDRVILVDDLNQASRAAEREELHAAMLASLSHDLRTPLASVLGSAESLITQGDTLASEGRLNLARAIQDDAGRLNRYIANLLDMTRLETGLAADTESRIDLTDVMNAALRRCETLLSAHRVTLSCQPDLPFVAGDEVLLEHVLVNLLDNAAKYAPVGSRIELRCRRDGEHVVVEVLDEGEGIRPTDLRRIFDKFYRARRTGPQRPGIGLGLAICRGYVEAMGGQIVARNRTDRQGAVFTITLPIPVGEPIRELHA